MLVADHEAEDENQQQIGDTLHGADAPLESEHDHEEEVPESDKPNNDESEK